MRKEDTLFIHWLYAYQNENSAIFNNSIHSRYLGVTESSVQMMWNSNPEDVSKGCHFLRDFCRTLRRLFHVFQENTILWFVEKKNTFARPSPPPLKYCFIPLPPLAYSRWSILYLPDFPIFTTKFQSRHRLYKNRKQLHTVLTLLHHIIPKGTKEFKLFSFSFLSRKWSIS